MTDPQRLERGDGPRRPRMVAGGWPIHREYGSAPGGRPGRFLRLLSCSKRDEGDGVSNTHDAARELKPMPGRKQDRRGTTRSSWTRGTCAPAGRPTHYVPMYRARSRGCFTNWASSGTESTNRLHRACSERATEAANHPRADHRPEKTKRPRLGSQGHSSTGAVPRPKGGTVGRECDPIVCARRRGDVFGAG